MMNKLRLGIISAVMAVSIVLPLFSTSTSYADTTTPPVDKCSTRFLTFPTWYRGLTDPDCNIESPTAAGGITRFIWLIVFNVIEIILQVIAYVATIMIIVGGFRFLTSAGNASGIEAGKKTLTNAVIGLVISIASIAIVNLIFGIITGFKP
jgi:hypothetical protein